MLKIYQLPGSIGPTLPFTQGIALQGTETAQCRHIIRALRETERIWELSVTNQAFWRVNNPAWNLSYGESAP